MRRQLASTLTQTNRTKMASQTKKYTHTLGNGGCGYTFCNQDCHTQTRYCLERCTNPHGQERVIQCRCKCTFPAFSGATAWHIHYGSYPELMTLLCEVLQEIQPPHPPQLNITDVVKPLTSLC